MSFVFSPRLRSGIARNLIKLLLTFGIAPLILLAAVFFSFYVDVQLKSVAVLQEEIARRIASDISAQFGKTIGQIRIFTRYLYLDIDDKAFLTSATEDLLEISHEFDMITIADPEGREICKVSRNYTFRPFELGHMADSAAFRNAVAGKPHIGRVALSRFSRFPQVDITVPIRGPAQKTQGVLTATVNVFNMWNIISKYQMGERRYAYIVDRAGNLIAYKDTSSVLENKNLGTIDGVGRLVRKGIGRAHRYRGIDGKYVIGAGARIAPTGWGAVVEEPVFSAYHNLYLISAIFIGIVLLCVTLAFFLGLRFSFEQIVRPIRRLQAEAHNIARGDFERTIRMEREDEIGQLSDSFNQMVGDLRRTTVSRDLLVKEIEERKQIEVQLREERDKIQKYLDVAGAIIVAISKDESVALINKRGCTVLGYTADEMIGSNWFDMAIPPEDRKEIRRVFNQLMSGRIEPVEFYENRLFTRDGHVKIVAWHNTVLTDDAGGIIGSLSSGEDVTRRRQEEVERVRLATVVEHAAEVVLVTDLQGCIQYANPAFESISGYAKDEVIGRNIRILETGRHDPSFYELLWKTISGGKTWKGIFINKNRNGGEYRMEATISPIFDTAGKIVNYVSVQRDVTREVELEEQLRRTHKMEAIGTLAGGIAHDFNNILAAVIGYTELCLSDTEKGSDLHGNLVQALNAGKRARELVKQILTFSRQSESELKPVQIRPVVEEALKLIRASLPSTIDIRLRLGSDSLIMGDATRIHQIVMNLCTNAGHAMIKSGGALSVSLDDVDVNEDFAIRIPDLKPGPYIRLCVKDTGHGMTADVIERIFDPYFTTKEVGEGSGLGLSLVHGIVTKFGGDIAVESRAGAGSEFAVFFPMIRTEASGRYEQDEWVAIGGEHILFVDDEVSLVDMGQQLLESIGYTVTTFTRPLDALHRFREQPGDFDLVITDLTMPEMSGDRLASELMACRPDIPVILYTGFSDGIDRDKALGLGIRALVAKPFMKKEIAAVIRRVLDGVTAS